MKKVLIFFVCVLMWIAAYSQTTFPSTQNIGSPTTLVNSRGGLTSNVAFVMTTFADTATANSNNVYTKSYAGSLLFTTSDSGLWYRAPGANKWIRASNGNGTGGSGGGGGGGTINALTNGLTLTGATGYWGGTLIQNTTISGAGFKLRFDNLDSFAIRYGSTKRIEIGAASTLISSPDYQNFVSTLNNGINLVTTSGNGGVFRDTSVFLYQHIYMPGIRNGGATDSVLVWNASAGEVKMRNISSFGGGSVSNFSSGNLSPLFTTSVATASTTPALSFTLSNAGGYKAYWNNTASSAAPAFNYLDSNAFGGNWYVQVQSANQKFAVQDSRATQTRYFSGADAYNMTFDSIQFIVKGTFGSGLTIPSYTGAQMFFNPRKAAFRAGEGGINQWLDINVGPYSTAFGSTTVASGDYSFAQGISNQATNTAAVALGNGNLSSGSRSFTMGLNNTAAGYTAFVINDSNYSGSHHSFTAGYRNGNNTYSGTVIGQFNDSTEYSSPTAFVSYSRAFQIGGGTGVSDRKNIFTVLFDGRTIIGNSVTRDTSAILKLVSTTKGFLMPVVTGTQMNAIPSPSTGLIIYNTDSVAFCYYNGAAWIKIGAATGGGGGGTGWLLQGNSITAGVSVLGTTNNADLNFITNNVNTMTLDSLGGRLYLKNSVDPLLSIKQQTSDQEYQLRVGLGTGIASQSFNLYDVNSSKSLITGSGNRVIVGNHISPYSQSTLYVKSYGSSGTNIDAQPDSTVADYANIEVMKSDYSLGEGIALRGFGNVGVAGQYIMGYLKKNMGVLDLTNTTNLIVTSNNTSLRFGTNNIERMVLDSNGRLGLGVAVPNASSLVDITSTTKGFLSPRMNGTQMNAISSPATGLLVYNTDSIAFCYYNGSAWIKIGAATGGGGGSVTSVATGYGLSGGTITTTGTLIADTATLFTKVLSTISLTTNGSTGAATWNPTTRILNIPQYTSGGGSGTVTLISAGNGMSFSNITTSGTVTMGTPSSVTLASTNSVSSGTHTHAFAPGGTSSQVILGDGTLGTYTNSVGWLLSGNSISAGTDFLGTTNNASLRIRTNNTERMVIDSNGRIGIGTTSPVSTALVEMTSTTQGVLTPRMNGVQQAAISSPATGLLIYNTDSVAFCYYTGSQWVKIGSTQAGSGTVISISNGYGVINSPNPITTLGTVTADSSRMFQDVLATIAVTTVGTIGAATWNPTTRILNIPQYIGGGGSGFTTLAPIGTSPNANGASSSGVTLNLEPANGTYGGVISADAFSTQTMGAGTKLFTKDIIVNGATVGITTLTVALGDSSNLRFGIRALNNNHPTYTGNDNTAIGYESMVGATSGYSNTATGYKSLQDITTGHGNTGFGRFSLGNTTTGTTNTAVGNQALFTNTTGSFNTAVGSGALNSTAAISSNTAMGSEAMQSSTTGSFNSAFGRAAMENNGASGNTGMGYAVLRANTTGAFNVAVGYEAARTQTTASGTTAIGYQALYTNTAINQTAVGSSALFSNTTGTSNTGIGYAALYSNTTGSRNTSLGNSTLLLNTISTDNTAIGFYALGTSDGGDFNTMVGSYAGRIITTGDQNTGVGTNVFYYLTTGQKNVAIGAGALENTTTGSFNVALGQDALLANTTGSGNIGIGWNGGANNFTGINNISIGYGSAKTVTGGDANIFIGRDAGWQASQNDTVTNSIAIGYQSYTTKDNLAVLGASTITETWLRGKVGVNVENPDSNLQVNGGLYTNRGVRHTNLPTGAGTKALRIDASTGTVYMYDTVPGGVLITANNGLSTNTTTNVQLGGNPLVQNTTISTSAFNFSMLSSNGSFTGEFTNSSTGHAVSGVNTSTGAGISAYSLSGFGAIITSAATYAVNAQTETSATNTMIDVMTIDGRTTGTPAANLGTSLRFTGETSTTAGTFIGQTGFRWTTVTHASRVSEFVISGVNAAITGEVLNLSGTGALQLNNYGSGTFSGTPTYTLAVDASGNVIETTAATGTVTSFTFTDANGFDGTVTNSTTTPTLSLTTTVSNTQMMYSNSGAVTGSSAITTTGQAIRVNSTNTTSNGSNSIIAVEGNSLTTGTAVFIGSSSLTQGNLLNMIITGTAAAGDQKGMNISLSGANASSSITTYGGYISNSHTGTTANNYGLFSSATNAANVNFGVYGNATGGAYDYAIYGAANSEANSFAGYFAGNVMIASSNTTGGSANSSFVVNSDLLTTGTSGYISSSSVTSGTLLSLVSTSTALAANNELLNIGMSGANGTSSITATGARISVTNTGTSSTNVALSVTASGASTDNFAIDATGNGRFTGQYYSVMYTLTDAATIALDWNNGNCQKVTLGGNRTFTFANPKAGARYLIELIQDGTGERTVTWPTIKWQGGTTPTLTKTAGKTDLIFIAYDGTDYFGSASLNF